MVAAGARGTEGTQHSCLALSRGTRGPINTLDQHPPRQMREIQLPVLAPVHLFGAKVNGMFQKLVFSTEGWAQAP